MSDLTLDWRSVRSLRAVRKAVVDTFGEYDTLGVKHTEVALVDELIRAAEATRPPLPKTIALDLSPWPRSTPEDWREEARILREHRPDSAAGAALCDAVADAMDEAMQP